MKWLRRHTHTLTYVEELGHADHCVISNFHRPIPMRFIFHHVLPQVCGGKTVPENLVQLCDNDHYAVHVLLSELKITGTIKPHTRNNAKRVALAEQGYAAAQAAGTVNRIPDEGGSILP